MRNNKKEKVELIVLIGFVVIELILIWVSHVCKCLTNALEICFANILPAIIAGYVALYCYSNYTLTKEQQQKATIRSESGWRKRLFDLEQKENFSFEDLLLINSCINPFKQYGDDIDFYVNKTLLLLLHSKEKEDLENDPNKTLTKVFENIINKDKNNKDKIDINQNEYRDLKSLYEGEHIFGCSKEDIKDCIVVKRCEGQHPENKEYIDFSKEDKELVRICIHALLKDDWNKLNNEKHCLEIPDEIKEIIDNEKAEK